MREYCEGKGIYGKFRLFELYLLRKLARFIPDRKYLELLFPLRVGYKLNLDNPQTFNEKLSWLKLYNRKPIYSQMADKYEVKRIVEEKIGKEYVVENYGVYDTWDQIDFDSLPAQFVIKCTHDSGGAHVCRDKKTFDYSLTKQKIEKNCKRNYFYLKREWVYKDIKPRIIIDKYLDDHTGNELRDYKFLCFNGQPIYMYCTIKGKNIFENYYDMNFTPVGVNHGFPRHLPEFEKPEGFELMKVLASKLSQGIPFVRVDFFEVEGKVYFGEFTFYDWAGLRPFEGDWDKELGKLIVLS